MNLKQKIVTLEPVYISVVGTPCGQSSHTFYRQDMKKNFQTIGMFWFGVHKKSLLLIGGINTSLQPNTLILVIFGRQTSGINESP